MVCNRQFVACNHQFKPRIPLYRPLQQLARRRHEGTLGLLLNDRQLYLNLNKTLVSADTLLNNLREHPKRYVHFSLFGKKDK